MKGLTSRQTQLIEFIADHLQENGYPPSIREMAQHMNIRSTNGVNDHLKALERKGYLTRKAGLKSRAIALTKKSASKKARERSSNISELDLVSIPLLGQVAAGVPILAEQHIEQHLHVDKSLAGSGAEIFALRVEGESMIEKGILPGDLVFVRRQNTANSGQVIVAMLDGEATVKTYRPQADKIVLEPANSSMEPIVIEEGDFQQVDILGIVTGVFRKM